MSQEVLKMQSRIPKYKGISVILPLEEAHKLTSLFPSKHSLNEKSFN